MNKSLFIRAILPALGIVLTPVVIGRYGDLTAEALIGFGMVATLVALIILEYRHGAARSRTGLARRAIGPGAAPADVVPFKRPDDTRAAA